MPGILRDAGAMCQQRGCVILSPRSQADGMSAPIIGPGASARRSSPLHDSSRQQHSDPAEIISSGPCLIVALIISSTPLRRASDLGDASLLVGFQAFCRSPGLSIRVTTEVTQN